MLIMHYKYRHARTRPRQTHTRETRAWHSFGRRARPRAESPNHKVPPPPPYEKARRGPTRKRRGWDRTTITFIEQWGTTMLIIKTPPIMASNDDIPRGPLKPRWGRSWWVPPFYPPALIIISSRLAFLCLLIVQVSALYIV